MAINIHVHTEHKIEYGSTASCDVAIEVMRVIRHNANDYYIDEGENNGEIYKEDLKAILADEYIEMSEDARTFLTRLLNESPEYNDMCHFSIW